MTDRNWDAEMAKIDRQLASISDDQLVANRAATAGSSVPSVSSAPSAPATGRSSTRRDWGVAIRVSLAAVLGVGVLFWPYSAACGLGLAGYLGAVASVVTAGVWAAVSAWRARAPRAHALALLVMVWGMSLAVKEVLPRTGYARDVQEWVCK